MDIACLSCSKKIKDASIVENLVNKCPHCGFEFVIDEKTKTIKKVSIIAECFNSYPVIAKINQTPPIKKLPINDVKESAAKGNKKGK